METIEVKTWEEFIAQLAILHKEREKIKSEAPLPVSNFFYRGHSNSIWKLETALERFVHSQMSLLKYYKIIHASVPRIETFTETSWDIPSLEDYEKWLKEANLFLDNAPAINYMTSLRHQGFPSPLLDWTSSPYISGFFAFDKANDEVPLCLYMFSVNIWERGKRHQTGSQTFLSLANMSKLIKGISYNKAGTLFVQRRKMMNGCIMQTTKIYQNAMPETKITYGSSIYRPASAKRY
jgi:hypothetical protein